MSTQNSLSPWNYKPWWCQPWSIVLTAIALIGGSWLLTKTLWISILVAIPILTWMVYFVFVWPQLMKRSGILEHYQQQASDSIPD